LIIDSSDVIIVEESM